MPEVADLVKDLGLDSKGPKRRRVTTTLKRFRVCLSRNSKLRNLNLQRKQRSRVFTTSALSLTSGWTVRSSEPGGWPPSGSKWSEQPWLATQAEASCARQTWRWISWHIRCRTRCLKWFWSKRMHSLGSLSTPRFRA